MTRLTRMEKEDLITLHLERKGIADVADQVLRANRRYPDLKMMLVPLLMEGTAESIVAAVLTKLRNPVRGQVKADYDVLAAKLAELRGGK